MRPHATSARAAPSLPRAAGFALELDPTVYRPWPARPAAPAPRPASLREAIVRWLEQEL